MLRLQVWRDTSGQDLAEYALATGAQRDGGHLLTRIGALINATVP